MIKKLFFSLMLTLVSISRLLPAAEVKIIPLLMQQPEELVDRLDYANDNQAWLNLTAGKTREEKVDLIRYLLAKHNTCTTYDITGFMGLGVGLLIAGGVLWYIFAHKNNNDLQTPFGQALVGPQELIYQRAFDFHQTADASYHLGWPAGARVLHGTNLRLYPYQDKYYVLPQALQGA